MRVNVPNTVTQQLVDGNLSDTHLNVPALLTIDLWMAMPEAHLLVLALLAIKFWIAMLETRLNVPALLAINCYMAILETRLNVPALLAINRYMAILETRLNVPTLLAINFRMAMLETRLRNPTYCWTTTCGRQLVRCTSKRTSIVGHQSLDGNVGNGSKRPKYCWPTTHGLQIVRPTSKRTNIVGHRLTNGKVRGLSTQHRCPTKTYTFIKLLVFKNILFYKWRLQCKSSSSLLSYLFTIYINLSYSLLTSKAFCTITDSFG